MSSYLEQRETFQRGYIHPDYTETASAEFRVKNREFWAKVNADVMEHIKSMVVLCGGDLDNVKDPHNVSTRHTAIVNHLYDAKNQTADAVMSWVYTKRS